MITIQPVVLCGGSGARLWPLSREKYPKQLLQLTGAQSLFQSTLTRLNGLEVVGMAEALVVCNEEYRFVIAEQLRLLGQPGRLLLEPTGRNTAPALTLAALEARRAGADPVLLVMPSDHVIADTPAFQDAVVRASNAAHAGHVVTFGIHPQSAATGYGYIACGQPVGDSGAYALQSFKEKPQAQDAQAYVDSGQYLWNAGIFMVRASVWLAAMQHCRADILSACERAWNASQTDGSFIRVDAASFGACPSDSIDFAVMERIAASAAGTILPTAVVMPLSAGWSDVGAWDALWDVLPKDATGNAQQGDAMVESCRDTLVMAQSRLVACIGVDDLVVIETPDAVLVAHKRHTQDVKKIVTALKQQNRAQALNHRKVFRPWGWYDSVDQGARFQVKRIVVKPGASLSLQMHHHRAEHWIVVSGTARVTKGTHTELLSENQSTYIPLGTVHRLENPGRVDLEMIEVQSGSYLGEDDIVRFEDVYGRLAA